ncbi:helix-turn-helix domain-containing protein [Gordonia sp. (in: high G+C Gram-positive bacteria)]|uniref:helix-turn-helix domain-containing protein n=1 Tax=Gordonia sp. (in: high G+C Gram-positive bacteria) TaxID=84139 RepID=UPI0026238556|nr:helix-turn-helix domain-containing protein [Gordonia sp. (in: high G+C Gram-positive bacteria)]
MNDAGLQLEPRDRDLLLRTARSRTAPHGLVTRARIVLDCAEVGAGEAARRSGVSVATASKWARRFTESGLDGLRDSARTGRPSISDAETERVLSYALTDPPPGARRWSTRAVAQDGGFSQAMVSRVRRRYFPEPDSATRLLPESSTFALTYADVTAAGCAVAVQLSSTEPTGESAPAALVDAVQTVACAAFLRRPLHGYPPDRAPDTLRLLHRAAEHIPAPPPITLFIDVPLDDRARRWLTHHQEFTVRVVDPAQWPTVVHRLAETLDSRQLPELQATAQRIRAVRAAGGTEFTWARASAARSTGEHSLRTALAATPNQSDESAVVEALCAALREGELLPGTEIGIRGVARRAGLSLGGVVAALEQLSSESLLSREGSSFILPVPETHDVTETYTARGLLGTAIARKLASSPKQLPPAVTEHLQHLILCDRLGLAQEAYKVDLDFQNELARAANLPRISWMFVQLSLQLRLLTHLIGLDYRYPTQEIVTDGQRLVDAFNGTDPEAAVTAWRRKTDNCARYMIGNVDGGRSSAGAGAGGLSRN